MNERLEIMRRQMSSNSQAAQMVGQEFRELERTVNVCFWARSISKDARRIVLFFQLTDQRVHSFLAMAASGVYRSQENIREASEELKRKWTEFRHRLDHFRQSMSTVSTYFTLIEETEMWIRETIEYISEIGRRSQQCQSSEEANRLMEQLEQYMKPRQMEQDERMRRIEQMAILLFGEEAEHRIQHIKRKYKEIVDSFVLVSDQLFSLAETCRTTEAKKIQVLY